jgi:capsular polysaccharide export protein
LAAALDNHPQHRVVLKIHPDVAAGRKRGHFDSAQLRHPRLLVSADGGHPTALLEAASAVYVVTSQLGFEALLWQRPVHCFGMPFYAGWGLSHDHLPPPARRRGRNPDLVQLVHATLVTYPRYLDPHRQERCTPERLIQVLGLQRRQRQGLPKVVEAFGFKPWKQPILRRFLPGSRIRYRRRHSLPSTQANCLAIWGRDPGKGVLRRLREKEPPALLHIEDGFLRSVGLGANLVAPLSWVVDRRGIYYDATRASDLEWHLAHHAFSDAERQRGAGLRRRLVATGLTKYNLQGDPWQRPKGAARVVLVPGQVESDASIRYGAEGIRSNLQLLQAVRRAEPDAWLVYKPHPDVVAGLRQGSEAGAAARHCDQILLQGAMDQLLAEVDAVHVITSLAGFEALLRGVSVHTWGLPFYAGWGLTHDQLHCGRRGRLLSLDELVHGALIHYPRYVSRHSGWALEPEEAIEELLAWRGEAALVLAWWQRLFRHWGRMRERILRPRAQEQGF